MSVLARRGYCVRALARHAPTASKAVPGMEFVQADILDCDALQSACEGVRIVFHLAGLLHVGQPTPEMEADYERVNVQGTYNVAEAARVAGAQRFVFFSTISVYGKGCGEALIDETWPANPQTYYARSKAEAEAVALSAMPSVVLRLAAVYGSGMKGNYARLCRAIERGLFVQVGNGLNRRTLVHVHDACAAALVSAEHPLAVGQTYNVTDGDVHTFREIAHAIYSAYGRRTPRLFVPAQPVRALVKAMSACMQALGTTGRISVDLIDKLLEDVAVSGA
ncbi:MAG: NAD-dependent epimerase/dehydratase family protein, partial [Anaerolineae bacterium]